MNDKLQVELKQAIDFAAKGYDIECYLIVSKPGNGKKVRHARGDAIISKDDMIALSLNGREPQKGKMAPSWRKTKKELWSSDITATYPRHKLVSTMAKHGYKDPTFVSYLANKLHCIRKVM